MIEKHTENQSPKGRSQKDKKKAKNRLGCLILILIGLYFLIVHYPGFIAYEKHKKRASVIPFMKTIHSSLKIYAEKQQKNLFPEKIGDYGVLRQMVSDADKSIPKNQADTKIEYFQYETTDRNDYILRINIEGEATHFFVLYPAGIIEIIKHDPISDNSVMELVKMLLFMDRALQKKDAAEYFKYYQPDASIHITYKTYRGHQTDKNRKELKSIVYEDMESYSNSLLDFYSNTFLEYRKREEIFIKRKEQKWEVHSGYIEEGITNGQKYSTDGRSMYEITFSQRPKYIVNDKSYALIYLIEN